MIKITNTDGRYTLIGTRDDAGKGQFPQESTGFQREPGRITRASSTSIQPYICANFTASGEFAGGRTLTEGEYQATLAAAKKHNLEIQEITQKEPAPAISDAKAIKRQFRRIRAASRAIREIGDHAPHAFKRMPTAAQAPVASRLYDEFLARMAGALSDSLAHRQPGLVAQEAQERREFAAAVGWMPKAHYPR